MKRVIAMILCLTMLGCSLSGFPITATGEEQPTGTPIGTVEEFVAMDPAGSYYLTGDIDFSGKTYTRNVYEKSFTGLLDGNGYKLLGITIKGTNSDAGIFGNMFGGTLKNLTIGAEDAFVSITSTGGGYSVAAIAGTMANGATFDNVTIYANVKGGGKTAGFTCYMTNGKITITDCAVYGTVSGNPAAGFLAMSNDYACDVEIRDSENHATVSAQGSSAGGFYTVDASTGGSRKTNMIITGCINYGAISATDWRVGGIVGEFNEEKTSTLKVDYCYNLGSITMKGSGGYAAGIVGGLAFHNDTTGKRSVSNVYNAGTVRNTQSDQRAYALCSGDKSCKALTLTNGAYMMGSATNDNNPCNNTNATGVTKASELSELVTAVLAFPASEEGNRFVADVGNNNSGYPILNREATSHNNITTYECGRKICQDCGGILTGADEEAHVYNEVATQPSGYVDGYIVATCQHCGASEVRKGTASRYQVTPVDGVYHFDSADDFRWYAANLNAELLTGKESIVLDKDIDMSGVDFTPIGTKKAPFRGVFDGQYHTLKNLTVKNDDAAGLFGYLGLGAKITNLAFDTPLISGKNAAGALFAGTTGNAVVTVKSIVAINATVSASEGAAGSLIGTTENASDVSVSAAVVNNATVSGKTVGGVIGDGTGTALESSFVNATITSTNKQAGTLAYYSGGFTAKNCFYVKNGSTNKTNGKTCTAEDFANGKIAYLANTYESDFVFGVKNGAVTFADNAFRMVRIGAKKIYTDKVLSTKNGVAVYAAEADGGVSVAIVVDPATKARLYDLAITVKDGDKTKTVVFGELTLNRYLAVGDNYYTTEKGMVLYTVTLDGVSASATYTIGSAYNGTAEVLR